MKDWQRHSLAFGLCAVAEGVLVWLAYFGPLSR